MNGWRWIFAPLGLLFGFGVLIRNFCYKRGIFKSYNIPGLSICIGNLNLGGSGKSPLTLYLLQKFQNEKHIQIVSRGYGRKTKGHLCVSANESASIVGDEPLLYCQYTQENDEVHVSENRTLAIQKLNRGNDYLLLLDDAFQHRKITAGLNLLVSDFNAPFFEDHIFPVGNLREPQIGAKRADAVIFTKCPNEIQKIDKERYCQKAEALGLSPFFSRIKYLELKPISKIQVDKPTHVVLVTGIAQPKSLINHLERNHNVFAISFTDHHDFTLKEIKEIHKKFDTFEASKTMIITTEKDFMRLKYPEILKEIESYPWYVQPIAMEIEKEQEFINFISNYVRKN